MSHRTSLMQVNASYIVQSVVEGQDPVTIAGLNLAVNTFLGGKLTIVCVADLFQVYNSRAEVTLDEERPRLASVLGNHHQAQGRVVIREGRANYDKGLQ